MEQKDSELSRSVQFFISIQVLVKVKSITQVYPVLELRESPRKSVV